MEKATHCGICNDLFRPDSYRELHSETSLHLERKGDKYLVTDPPKGHKFLKGKLVSLGVYRPEEDKVSDGVCLCVVCHDEIKRIALAESRYRDADFRGNTPTPKVLEEITNFFVNRKKPIVYEEHKLEENKLEERNQEIVFLETPKITFY